MHILSGKFKGYKLKNIPKTGIRPTMDRVKEAIFSMIRDRLDRANVLDLFAGTGSLGIEALSQGAEVCHFVDNSFKSTRCIKENLKRLKISDDAKVIKNSAFSFIAKCEKNLYDIIFIDPPYKTKMITKIVKAIYRQNIMKQNGLIVTEYGNDEDLSEFEENIFKTKVYGDTKISLIKSNK